MFWLVLLFRYSRYPFSLAMSVVNKNYFSSFSGAYMGRESTENHQLLRVSWISEKRFVLWVVMSDSTLRALLQVWISPSGYSVSESYIYSPSPNSGLEFCSADRKSCILILGSRAESKRLEFSAGLNGKDSASCLYACQDLKALTAVAILVSYLLCAKNIKSRTLFFPEYFVGIPV